MLPLWIIDITKESERRDAFQERLRKVDHVAFDSSFVSAKQKQNPADAKDAESASPQKAYAKDWSPESKTGTEESLSQGELLEEEEKRAAEKNADIKGCYWYYSAFDDAFRDMDLNSTEKIEGDHGIAQKLYKFQEEIVEAGRAFIKMLRQSNARPYQTINVIVLADSTDRFTQTVFPAVAMILQKEKGRFLPAHIHQGMSIYGALYVPCDINTLNVHERYSILRLLNEVEMQNKLLDRGYDHILLYQNVQNRTECNYPLLGPKQLAAYLLQCIVHLFLACDSTHPLISGTSSDDALYFSMGASSLYFDMAVEDNNDANRVASNLIKYLKRTDDVESLDRKDIYLLDEKLYTADFFIKDIKQQMGECDIADYDMESPSPHPILHYSKKNLKRLYYYFYLRYFPAKLLSKITEIIDANTSDLLNKISSRSTKMFQACEMAMPEAIQRVISKVRHDEGALFTVESLLKKAQELMSTEREHIRQQMESQFWIPILNPDGSIVPKNQLDYFDTYHEAYKSDLSLNNNGAGQAELKQQATDRLLEMLSAERTTLATLGRCFLLGVMCVLTIIPLLSLIYDDVKDHAVVWSSLVFMIPVIIQLIVLFLYLRKRNACIRVLKAYYRHDAYARLANRIEFEAGDFYTKMTDLCEAYLQRTKRIREEVMFEVPDLTLKMPFPPSMFNQPLCEGSFAGEEMIPSSEIERCRIRVNYVPEPSEKLTVEQYYLLINRYCDEIAILYRDVAIPEEHARRYDEATHQYVFVGKEQLRMEQEDKWNAHRREFRSQLLKAIKEDMLPRENPTVSEKLIQYKRKTEKYYILDSMIGYAAVNGEIVCDSDPEYVDVKINKNIDELLRTLPCNRRNVQGGEYDELYKKYLFITRWRCFDRFSFNRILPTEDFDANIREKLVYEAEQEAKKKAEKQKLRQQKRMQGEPVDDEPETEKPKKYVVQMSALILWAVCSDESSTEWMKLFGYDHYKRAFEDKEKIREVMNQDD